MVVALWFPPVGTFGILLAAGGTIVALKEFKGVLRSWLVVACLLLGAGEILSIIINDRTHNHEMDEQKHAVDEQKLQVANLKAMIQANEVRNAADMAYMKAKLEDALMHPGTSFNARLFAKTFAQQLQQGIEVLSNQDIANHAIEFAKKLRRFSSDEAQGREQDSAQEFEEMRAAGNDEVKRRAVWQKWLDKDRRRRSEFEARFKTEYLAQAISYRNDLWKRLGIQESQLGTGITSYQGFLAFRGLIAGVDSASDAAGYLESLAHQLLAKVAKRPS